MQKPTGRVVNAIVRMAGARERAEAAGPDARRERAAAIGQRERKSGVPAMTSAADSPRATCGPAKATIAAVSNGPLTNETSIMTESNA